MKFNHHQRRRLGVNIDHIATLREARKVSYPRPLMALSILKECAVDQVTIHLREDRRHIRDDDLKEIIQANVLPVNLEMAVTDEMLAIAVQYRPQKVTFVPERREEVTTEGGLDCVHNQKRVTEAIARLKAVSVHCSLFVDADPKQINAASECGADAVEIHTGAYCSVLEDFFVQHGHYDVTQDEACAASLDQEVHKIILATELAVSRGLKVYAGHGLHVFNLKRVTHIPQIEEYNIGHAIIARAVFVGLKAAIQEIQALL